MALLLTEADVKSLLTMPLALECVQHSFQRLADGSALLHPRQRLHVPSKSYLHYMAAADGTSGYMGLKIYTSSREGLRFLITLFSAESGDLLALIEADFIGQMRTGAASGVATRLLAREDARTVGIVGTGFAGPHTTPGHRPSPEVDRSSRIQPLRREKRKIRQRNDAGTQDSGVSC